MQEVPICPVPDELTRLRPARALLWLALDWAMIFGSYAVAARLGRAWGWLLAALVTINRQHALAVIMHDAAHFRLLPSHRWAERVSDWLIAYPLGITTAAFRAGHLLHHRHLGAELDPDLRFRLGRREWTFPMPARELAWLSVRLALGGSLLYIHETKRFYMRLPESREALASAGWRSERTLFLVLGAMLIVAMGGYRFLGFWTLCSLQIPLAMRLRCVAEHSAVPSGGVVAGTRNYLERPWLAALFAPHHINYHHDHHLNPRIPFYSLPAFHRFLQEQSWYRLPDPRLGALLRD